MIKTLVKKQLAELLANMFGRSFMGKKNKEGSKKGMIALYVLLFTYIFAVFAFMFYNVSEMMFRGFHAMGIEWLGFSYMGIMALTLGTIGTVFMTNSMLYSAKDNELLMSLPIKPSVIIFARILSLYIMDVIYGALIMIPCIAAYNVTVGFSLSSLICGAVLLGVRPLLSLAISLVLGVLLALLLGRMKNKSLFTMVISVSFIIVYFFAISKMQSYLMSIIANGQEIAKNMMSFAYPLYAFGRASTGHIISLALICLMAIAVFAAVYFVISVSYMRLATMKKGGSASAYREKRFKTGNVNKALVGKEFSRFWSLPAYMMNGGIGALFMLIGAVMLVIKSGDILDMISALPAFAEMASVVAMLIIVMISSMNLISASSISLEGKTMWLLRSLPIDPWSVLKSKIVLQFTITCIPAVALSLTAAAILPISIADRIMIPVAAVVFNLFFSMLGLWVNLKHPSFDWTSEIVPIKQGASTLISMMCGMGISGILAIVYFVTALELGVEVPSEAYIASATALCAVGDVALYRLIRVKGSKIFETF